MEIHLNNIRPIPMIADGLDPQTEIWNRTCRFEKGKRYLISAPSGKGKSTLLHLIYGLRDDYEGNIQIADKDIKQIQEDQWSNIRQKQLSIVFQDLRLFGDLSAMENIQIKSTLTQHLTEQQIKEMADRLGIVNLLAKNCSTLSYGQRQRVAIIRALAQPFDLLMLDEPFSHLDRENIKIACSLIDESLKAQSAGLMLVSLGDDYDWQYDEVKRL